MPFTARSLIAAVALTAVVAQPALATEISASTVRDIVSAPAHHIASVQSKAPVLEAHLMDHVIAIIKHIIGQDGGGADGTIHRG